MLGVHGRLLFGLLFDLRFPLLLLLLLMLDLELLVALRRHLDLIADAVVYLGLALDRAPDNLIRENCLVDYAVEGTRRSEVLIVDVRILGRVDSYKVASLLVLRAGLSDHLTMSQGHSLTHTLMDGSHIVLRVLGNVAFHHL